MRQLNALSSLEPPKSRLEPALACARRGWRVLPLHSVTDGGCSCGNASCGAPGKHPRIRDWQPHASSSEAQIREWWNRWPDANIGIATGAGSNLIALDIDPRHGGTTSLAQLEAEHGPLPSTFRVKTGGGGVHVLFAHPGLEVKNRVSLWPGIDLRGDGGFIVAPFSQHVSGETYLPLSAESKDALAPMPSWLRAAIFRQPSVAAVERHGEPLDLIVVLDGVPEGERDETLFRAACKLRRQGAPRELAEAFICQAAANCSPPFPEEQALAKVESAWRYPAGDESGSVAPVVTVPRSVYRTFSTQDLLDDVEHHDTLVPGLLYPGSTTLIGAWMGAGKTTLVMALIAALVKQHDAFDLLQVGRLEGPIAYFSELAAPVLARTIQTMTDTYGITRRQLTDHVQVYGLGGDSILQPDVAAEFRRECTGAKVIIIDTYDAWLGANPNDTESCLQAYALLREFASQGAAILVLDHQGKTALGYTDAMSAVSGSSAKQRQPELVYRLDPVALNGTDRYNTLRCVKQRFGDAVALDLELDERERLVAQFADDDGDPTGKVGEARRFVQGYLSNGDAQLGTILEAGDAAGHSRATVRRAIDGLYQEGRVKRPSRGVYCLPMSPQYSPCTLEQMTSNSA